MAFIAITKAQTFTTVADGNWTNPLTWGTTPPMPGSTVNIDHVVVLNIDYGFSTGSITINASGQLTDNSNMRALALSGGAITINNGGLLDIARLALFAGTVTNNGTIEGDSLLVATALTSNSGAAVNVSQVMISTGGNFINHGNVVATNFLNIASTTNTGNLSVANFMNSKTFLNASTGIISVSSNFLNADSLASPAVCTNDGNVIVGNDWRNTDQILGSGKFCVQNNTMNTGSMLGTFDFCDLSGGNVDLNSGTIDPTITFCLFPCAVSITNNEENILFSVYPNPSNGVFTFNYENNIGNAFLDVFNIMGEKVYTVQLLENTTLINLLNEAKGLYFFNLRNNDGILSSGKVVVE